jgi:hypothetical protein
MLVTTHLAAFRRCEVRLQRGEGHLQYGDESGRDRDHSLRSRLRDLRAYRHLLARKVDVGEEVFDVAEVEGEPVVEQTA